MLRRRVSDRVGQNDENLGTMFTPFVMSKSSGRFLSMALGGNYSYWWYCTRVQYNVTHAIAGMPLNTRAAI